MPEPDLDELVERARTLALSGPRQVLGIAGPPGSGKSTLTRKLVHRLGPELAATAPMDGFHLANSVLGQLKRHDRKGAPDTFDAAGFVALLRRVRDQRPGDDIIYAPTFRRDLDESVGSALPIRADVPLVVTEGNYLLVPDGAWGQVAGLLDQCWFVELPERIRLGRLTARHRKYGSSPDQARARASGNDQRNAEVIEQTRGRADLVVRFETGRRR